MTDLKTVVLTGASGFIARHVALRLLRAGYRVRATVRQQDRADSVRASLAPHLDAKALDRLDFVTLDLTDDAGWVQALAGADALMHIASPFPMSQPKDEQDVIRPAVDGTLRALRAARAAGVNRVVMTSSSVAVMNCALPPGRTLYTEEDWTDLSHPNATAYVKSKTMAERAAWDFVRDDAPGMALTVINPVLVLGPPLDAGYGTSVRVVERVLRARDPMLPPVGFPVVDVRDVAELHVRALHTPAAEGQRIIAAAGFLWMRDMAVVLQRAYPRRRLVTRVAPKWLVRLLALKDPAIRTILPILGRREEPSAERARKLMGIDFIPAEQALLATGEWLVANTRI